MTDIAVGIVTFNPDINLLKENLENVSAQFSKVILFDNGSENRKEVEDCLKESVQESYGIFSGKNVGIAVALNQIMKKAKSDGLMWVLTLDQDSIIPSNLRQEFEKHIFVDKIAIICPRVFDRNSGVKSAWENSSEIVDGCITSGSLTNVSVWENLRGFDEDLFIDDVDTDYCMRVGKAGYKILRVNSVVLNHAVGKTRIVDFLGYKIVVYNHSAQRKYYQLRNRYYVSYKAYGHITGKCIYHTFAPIFKIVFFEEEKIKKLCACIRGINDGIAMGRKLGK